jgi:hypothetical protein
VTARKQEERKKSNHGKRRKESKANLMKGRISKETMMILFFLPLSASTLQIARNAYYCRCSPDASCCGPGIRNEPRE